LDNPIRREFHLLTLLSGSRPTALKTIRITDIDFRRRLIHIPRPKGGAIKAFDIPLSRTMVRCLLRAMRAGRLLYPDQAATWLFPADSADGHLVVHKEDRSTLSKYGNDLRQTYRTLAQVAGVSELDVHLLMNHSLPGVNAGYITRDVLLDGHLRTQQERISAVIEKSRRPDEDDRVIQWLVNTRVLSEIASPAQAIEA
jgi:integrase